MRSESVFEFLVIMEWSKQQISCLIEAYHNRPCLWDTACDAYKNKNLRCEAFEELVENAETRRSLYDHEERRRYVVKSRI